MNDVMVKCEIVSLEDIKNNSYNMDFAEEIDAAYLYDEAVDVNIIKSVDEFGRKRILNRF